MGLASFLPTQAWALVLALATVAIASLLVPYDLVAGLVTFRVFFGLVSGVQLVTALGIGAVVYRYRHRDDEDESEWRYED
jgi:hypothetical protein